MKSRMLLPTLPACSIPLWLRREEPLLLASTVRRETEDWASYSILMRVKNLWGLAMLHGLTGMAPSERSEPTERSEPRRVVAPYGVAL